MHVYPRKIQPKIKKHLLIPEIVVIHGARQTGKSTLLHIFEQELKSRVKSSSVVYFDLEDHRLLDLCNNGVDSVVNHLKAIGCDFKERIFLFIDEVQYLENPSSFLKYFFDHWKDTVKLIVSGSSTFAIKSKFKESLVGRTVDFELFGLDFEEFLVFKNISYDLLTDDKMVIQELKRLFLEFLYYGGYPRVVLENSVEIKENLLKQIANTYLRRDIRDLANIADINKFNKLLKILAFQSGSMLNTLELSNTIGVARETLEKYLSILENSYVIKLVAPFHRNIRSELTKMPKIYFEDLGLKNILAKGNLPSSFEGSDLETAVFSLLRKNTDADNIHFWRTTLKKEIDFVVENNSRLLAYEVKINARNKDRLTLLTFKKRYPETNVYLVGLDFIDKELSEDTTFMYPWQITKSLRNEKIKTSNA